MPRFLHLADIHIGSVFVNFDETARKQRRQDILDSLKNALEFAVDKTNGIDFILISGDLFDTANPCDKDTEYVQNLFESLPERLEIFLVPGNHDPTVYPGSVYEKTTFRNLILMNPALPNLHTTRYYDNTACNFYPMEYHPLRSKNYRDFFKAQNRNEINIAVVHGSLNSIPDREIDEKYTPIEPNVIQNSGMNYFALGHYHNFREYRFGNTTALYPGTLEGLNFRETGDRFLVAVEISPRGEVKIEKQKWNRRTLKEMEIDLGREKIHGKDELPILINRIEPPDPNLLLKVKLKGSIDFTPDIIKIKEKIDNGYFHLVIEDKTSIPDTSNLIEISKEKSIRGYHISKLLELQNNSFGRKKEVASAALKICLNLFNGGE